MDVIKCRFGLELSYSQGTNSCYVVLHFSNVSKVLFQLSVNRMDAVSIIVTLFISISFCLDLFLLSIPRVPYLSIYIYLSLPPYLSLPIPPSLYFGGERERDRESDNVLSLSGTSLWAYAFVLSGP